MPTDDSHRPVPSPFALPSIVAALLVLAAALRIVVLAAHAGDLASFVPDDSYYYFVPVQNALAGRGISFDGLTPTNGFHPLWFFVLVPLFAVFAPAGPDAPILAAMLVGGLLSVAAGYVLWRAVRLITGEPLVALFILAAYLFNPYLVSTSLNGLETGLHDLCVAALVYYTALLLAHDTLTPRQTVTFGVLVALGFLARTDTVILIGLLVAALLLRRMTARRLIGLAGAGALAAALASPWLIWNLVTFGSPVQSSGSALTTFARLTWAASSPGESPLPALAAYAALNLNTTLLYAGFSLITLLISGALLIPAILARRTAARRRLSGREETWLALAAAYAFAYIGFHVFIRWFMRDWYAASVLTVLYVGLGVLAALLLRAIRPLLARLSRSGRAAARLVVLGAVFLNGWLFVWSDSTFGFWDAPPKYPAQRQLEGAARWIRGELPVTARVGSFNAGILSYSAPQQIVNLDGVVNTAVHPFIAERNLLCFVAQADLDYVADYEWSFTSWGHILAGGGVPDGWSTPVYTSGGGDQAYTVLSVNKARLREATGCRPAE